MMFTYQALAVMDADTGKLLNYTSETLVQMVLTLIATIYTFEGHRVDK
jgi:hypothetical protein